MKVYTVAGRWQQVLVLVAREWRMYKKRLRGMTVNLLIIQPLSFSGIQGYIKPLMYFGPPLGRRAMMLMGGAVLMYFIHRSFSFATAFFFDVHRQNQVQVQAQSIPVWLIYLVRVGFSTFWTWLLLTPSFPIAKLILRSSMYTADTVWWELFGVMLLVAFVLNTYAFMCISAVSSLYGISKVRVRLNEILMFLGGFNAPWIAMYYSGKVWGILGLCSPFLYGTEAIRQALIPGTDMLPYAITIPAMLAWSVVFLLAGYVMLWRRLWTA